MKSKKMAFLILLIAIIMIIVGIYMFGSKSDVDNRQSIDKTIILDDEENPISTSVDEESAKHDNKKRQDGKTEDASKGSSSKNETEDFHKNETEILIDDDN